MKHRNILKQTILYSAMLISTLFVSCSDDDSEDSFLGDLAINLKTLTENEEIDLTEITVSLYNTVDNVEREKVTDATGKVVFLDLPAGTYTATVSYYVESEDYTLGGTQANIVVESNKEVQANIELSASNPNGGLVIKEIYYGGANDGYVSLFKDQFIEIFNNSSEVIYADGLYIANLYGETGVAGNEHPITNVLDVTEYVYADFIDQVPGNGTDYPIAPGKSIVIALNAINFKEDNPKAEYAVDNTGADLERYSVTWREEQGEQPNPYFDFDNPAVPNMNNIYMNSSLWLFNTYGAGVVIFRKEAEFSQSDIVSYVKDNGTAQEVFLTKVTVADIIDGVEILENSQAAAFKRIPETVDKGFSYLKADGGAFYSSISVRRKIDEKRSALFNRWVLKDTDNTGVDFESIPLPDPKGYNTDYPN